jgi:hypothetical protein
MEKFNVFVDYRDGGSEYAIEDVSMADAEAQFEKSTKSHAVHFGLTVRVILTDECDNTLKEWKSKRADYNYSSRDNIDA